MCKPGEPCDQADLRKQADAYFEDLFERTKAAFGEQFAKSQLGMTVNTIIVDQVFNYAIDKTMTGLINSKDGIEEALKSKELAEKVAVIHLSIDGIKHVMALKEKQSEVASHMLEMRLLAVRQLLDQYKITLDDRIDNKKLLTELVISDIGFAKLEKVTNGMWQEDWADGGVMTIMLDKTTTEIAMHPANAAKLAKAKKPY